MGQKVNPIGLRLGINKTWQSRWYADPREYADLLHEDLRIRKMVLALPECNNADIAEVEIVRHPQRVTIVIHIKIIAIITSFSNICHIVLITFIFILTSLLLFVPYIFQFFL